MKRMLAAPFLGEERWLQAITKLYKVVLHVGHDSEYFHAWAQDPAHFALLVEPLAKAETSIRASSWYQSNEARLVWADIPCLIPVSLPELS